MRKREKGSEGKGERGQEIKGKNKRDQARINFLILDFYTNCSILKINRPWPLFYFFTVFEK
ncbi:MAG: hypothetical protein DRR08_15725 [Candidatus Parabeggiatoa sp. nov. 2]|nr:MAG: hypothetical protein DRR08_15725 [Gammaproteobacteria bacterium]